MLKRVFCVVIFILLVTSMLTLAFNIRPVKASGTIYIRADGSIDPPTASIQRNGDLYTFTDNIYDKIVIERSNMIVDGAGYTLQGPGSGNGFYLQDSKNNVTIKGTNVKGFDWGISLNFGDSNNTIFGNNMTSNYGGVGLFWSSGNVLKNNNMINNDFNFMVVGYALSHFNHDVDTSNTVDGKPIYYWVSCENAEVPSDAGYVALVNSNNITVKGLRLRNNGQGILLAYTTNSQIISNNLTDNYYGIALLYSSNNSIYSNNIIDNSWCGVWVERSSENRLYHNNFIGNPYHVYFSVGPSVNTWDTGYPSGGNYWSDYNGTDTNSDGLGDTPYLVDADNQDRYPLMHPWSSLPVHNINTGFGYATIQEAIDAANSRDTVFVEAGIYREHVIVNKPMSLIGENKNATIIDGEKTGTVVDIGGFWNSVENVTLSGFTIQNSGEIAAENQPYYDSGIRISWSNLNNISGNVIRNNKLGIYILDSYYNTISNNQIINNSFGFYLMGYSAGEECDYNVISGNDVISNEYGMQILWKSNDNEIYHNKFVNNIDQVWGLSRNVWDDGYPSGGNYWSDYNGTDLYSGPYQNETGSDGIGDTPYVIDADNLDNYPLLPQAPYVPIAGDLNLDRTVDISDAILAALAFGSYPGHARWNSQADLNKDNAVDIFDIIILANNFGKPSF